MVPLRCWRRAEWPSLWSSLSRAPSEIGGWVSFFLFLGCCLKTWRASILETVRHCSLERMFLRSLFISPYLSQYDAATWPGSSRHSAYHWPCSQPWRSFKYSVLGVLASSTAFWALNYISFMFH